MGAKLCCTRKVEQPPNRKNLLAGEHDHKPRANSPKTNITILNNDSVPDKLEAAKGDDLDTKVTNNDEEKQNDKVADNGDDIPEDLNTKAEKCSYISEDQKTKTGDNGEDILENLDTIASDIGNSISDHIRPKSEISKVEAGENKPSELEVNMYMNELGDVCTSAAPLSDVSRTVTNSSIGLATSNSISPKQKEDVQTELTKALTKIKDAPPPKEAIKTAEDINRDLMQELLQELPGMEEEEVGDLDELLDTVDSVGTVPEDSADRRKPADDNDKPSKDKDKC